MFLQMLEVQDLVGQLGDVIGAFSARVWMHTTALQHARGLVATPYILCGVTVGAHLSARSVPCITIAWGFICSRQPIDTLQTCSIICRASADLTVHCTVEINCRSKTYRATLVPVVSMVLDCGPCLHHTIAPS